MTSEPSLTPFQIANGGVQSITIPSCIAPGQYLLRGEIIALHAATSPNGAQFYVRIPTAQSPLHLTST